MTKTTIKQIHLTNDEGNHINKVGWTEASKNPRINIYLNKAPTMADLEHYEAVAEVNTSNLDDIFRIGNIGPTLEDDIAGLELTELATRHSVSVGDVLVVEDDEHGTMHFSVANFGFDRLD